MQKIVLLLGDRNCPVKCPTKRPTLVGPLKHHLSRDLQVAINCLVVAE